ncbi:proteasome subunit beta type-4 isoform X2 [Heterodontus francisci]|uniref:proteasome subunit beta type-4 isoform X2 n=1 Tax=Heterodontus francisci TaxID=7792 RepID=UPI00355B65F7
MAALNGMAAAMAAAGTGSGLGMWGNGPEPGRFYSVPGSNLGPVRQTLSPMVTGTSVLGVKFHGGIILAADMLGSYGSMARFRNISRLMKVNNNTILGASGDYADYQYLKQAIEQMMRCKMNPLWNTVIIGGMSNGEGFLGYVDKLGVAYEAATVATGFGAYLAQPLMREVAERQTLISKDEARQLIERCLKVLYYRDARSYNRYQIATVTAAGVEIEGPMSAETNWEIAHLISGFE